jgi:uncharacterized membrane protein YqjE
MKQVKGKALGVLLFAGMATCCLLPVLLASSTAAVFSIFKPEYAGLAVLALIVVLFIYRNRRKTTRSLLDSAHP